MNIDYALSKPCLRCNAAIGEHCTNTQNYPVLPHKARKGEGAYRHTEILGIALADIATQGETTVNRVVSQYGNGNQHTNVSSVLTALVNEGKLTLVCKRGATRIFGAPVAS